MGSRTPKKLHIEPGVEFLKINDLDVSTILEISNSVLSGDGFIETGKIHRLEKSFPFIYLAHIGYADAFEIEYRDHAGNLKRETVEAIESSSLDRGSGMEDNLKLSFPEEDIALLRVRQFDDWKVDKKKKKFVKELKSIFNQIDSSRVENLIIDMRDNLGGYDDFGLLLFSYLYEDPIIEFKSKELIINKSEYYKYTKDMSRLKIAMLKAFSTRKINDSRYAIKKDKTLKPSSPSFPQYKGKVYLMIDGGTYSTGADFASLVKSYQVATFIGEETGGGYYGNTSGDLINFSLPHTKLRLLIPIIKYITNVKPTIADGRGVPPDYLVYPAIEDLIKGIDTELQFTLAIIKNK